MVVRACDPSTWEVEVLHGSGVQGQTQLLSESGTSLGYLRLPEKQKQKQTQANMKANSMEKITRRVNQEFSPRGPGG